MWVRAITSTNSRESPLVFIIIYLLFLRHITCYQQILVLEMFCYISRNIQEALPYLKIMKSYVVIPTLFIIIHWEVLCVAQIGIYMSLK